MESTGSFSTTAAQQCSDSSPTGSRDADGPAFLTSPVVQPPTEPEEGSEQSGSRVVFSATSDLPFTTGELVRPVGSLALPSEQRITEGRLAGITGQIGLDTSATVTTPIQEQGAAEQSAPTISETNELSNGGSQTESSTIPVAQSDSHAAPRQDDNNSLLQLKGEHHGVLKELKQIKEGSTTTIKDSLKQLLSRVQSLREGAKIALGNGLYVTHKELLCDFITNQLLLIGGHPAYCALCGRAKEEQIKSHATTKYTLRNMEQERGGRVVYLPRIGIAVSAKDAIWRILCSKCEHANEINVSESLLERYRRILHRKLDEDIAVKAGDVDDLLFAAASIMFRGFMVNVDLLEELCNPSLSQSLFSIFYSLKRYCHAPAECSPPPVHLFVLPSDTVTKEIDQENAEGISVPLFIDPYMRRVEMTHVATAQFESTVHNFLYMCFDQLHFSIPLKPSSTLEKLMLAKYPKDSGCHPNLAAHCGPDKRVFWLRNRRSDSSYFPPFLYFMSFDGATKQREKFESDPKYRQVLRLTCTYGPVHTPSTKEKRTQTVVKKAGDKQIYWYCLITLITLIVWALSLFCVKFFFC